MSEAATQEKQVFYLISDRVRENAHEFIDGLPLEDGWFVRVDKKKPARSEAQKGLWWLWITDYMRHQGEEKIEVEKDFKLWFLRPLLLRDDESGVLIKLWSTIEQTGDPEQVREAAALFHFSDTNVRQATEVLDEIEKFFVHRAIPFRHPDDIYLRAMGR